MPALRDERGMALLLVLVVVALLSALLTEFAFSTLVDLRLTETFRDSTRAYYLAKGGVRVGQMLLDEDRNGYDAPSEPWGQGVAGYPVGDGVVSIEVADLGGRLDLNRLVTRQGNIDAVFKGRFLRLFATLGAEDPEGLVDALADWLDADGDAGTKGAEDDYYRRLDPPGRCKDGPLDTVAELGRVRGFTPELLDLLAPHVTAHGAVAVNVNTATPEVLRALAEEMDGAAADDIVARRSQAPLERVDELKELPGSDAWYWAVNGQLAVTSPTYRIRSRGTVNDGARTLEAVVAKDGNKLLYLEVR